MQALVLAGTEPRYMSVYEIILAWCQARTFVAHPNAVLNIEQQELLSLLCAFLAEYVATSATGLDQCEFV